MIVAPQRAVAPQEAQQRLIELAVLDQILQALQQSTVRVLIARSFDAYPRGKSLLLIS